MRGIIQDMLITRKIEKTIKEVLNTLNAICFVAQSSNARLTANQKYIFISVFDLFGEDEKILATINKDPVKNPDDGAAIIFGIPDIGKISRLHADH